MLTAIKQAGRRRSSTSSAASPIDTKIDPSHHTSSIAKAFRMKDPSNIPFLRRMRRKSKPSPLKTVALRRELSTDSAKAVSVSESPSSVYSMDCKKEVRAVSPVTAKQMRTIIKTPDDPSKLANVNLSTVQDDSPAMSSPSWVRLQRQQLSPRNDNVTPNALIEATGSSASPADTPKPKYTGKRAAKQVVFADVSEPNHIIHAQSPLRTSAPKPESPIPFPSPLRVPDRPYNPHPLTPAPWAVSAAAAARSSMISDMEARYIRDLEAHHAMICGPKCMSHRRQSPTLPTCCSVGSSTSIALKRRSRMDASGLEILAEEQGLAMQGLEKEKCDDLQKLRD